MTLFNLVDDFLPHNIAALALTISWDQKDESLLRGKFKFLKTHGERKLRGNPNFHLQKGGTNSSRHHAVGGGQVLLAKIFTLAGHFNIT